MKKLLFFIILSLVISSQTKANFYNSIKSKIFPKKKSTLLLNSALSACLAYKSFQTAYSAVMHLEFPSWWKPHYPEDCTDIEDQKSFAMQHADKVELTGTAIGIGSLAYTIYCFVKAVK